MASLPFSGRGGGGGDRFFVGTWVGVSTGIALLLCAFGGGVEAVVDTTDATERGDGLDGEVGVKGEVARTEPVRTGGGSGAGLRTSLFKNAVGGEGTCRPRMVIDEDLTLLVSAVIGPGIAVGG